MAVAVLALLVGCGTVRDAAENNALIPALQQAWPQVSEDTLLGIGASTLDSTTASLLMDDVVRLEEALESADSHAIGGLYPTWTMLSSWASNGIEFRFANGEIGPSTVELREETLAKFTDGMAAISGGTK